LATGSRPYTAQSILQAIYDLADRGYPPKQIETELRKTIEPIDMPHIRTIQRYVKEHTRRDSSGRWSIVDAQPDEAAVLARAIKDILRGQHDGLLQLTRAEARVLHNILAIAPELDGHAAYRIALEYLRCTDAHDDTAVLDAAVAFRPWQDSQSL